MKFLAFNIVVAAALVYLFTGDRADFHAAADRAWKATDSLKTKALGVIERADTGPKAPPKPAAEEPPKPAAPAIAPAKTADAPKEPAIAARPAKTATAAPPAAEPPAPPSAAAPPPAPAAAQASESPAAPPTKKAPPRSPEVAPELKPMPLTRAARTQVAAASAALPPDVAKRRAEVLATGTVSATVKPGFMSSAERRRDLMLLSEEMELFSAEALSR